MPLLAAPRDESAPQAVAVATQSANATDGREMLDFAKLEDGFFKVEVPPGTDGALWKFERSHGQHLLMTVPPYLARSGAELLLPREVVAVDAAPR